MPVVQDVLFVLLEHISPMQPLARPARTVSAAPLEAQLAAPAPLAFIPRSRPVIFAMIALMAP